MERKLPVLNVFSQFEEEYNESQKEVIAEASSIVTYKDPKLYFIQGPPGTGKSHTIIGIIKGIFSVSPGLEFWFIFF